VPAVLFHGLLIVIIGAMFAEFDSIILLSLFFVYNKVRATNRVLAWVVRKENSGAARAFGVLP